MEDKLNPSYYKGLKNLFVKTDSGFFEDCQVIDIIENWTYFMRGGLATNLGNVIKYAMRCGKKAPDASYQASQKEKNIEEAGKIVWYAKRFAKCAKTTEKIIADEQLASPKICVYSNNTYSRADAEDICNAVADSYSPECFPAFKDLMLSIQNVRSNELTEDALADFISKAESLLQKIKLSV